MPSRQALINNIEQEANELHQAYGAVKYWHPKQMERIAQEYAAKQAQLQARLQQEGHRITTQYQETVTQIQRQTAALNQQFGYTALPWLDPAWSEKWPSAMPQTIPRLTRIGQLTETNQWGDYSFPALIPIIGGRNLLFKATGSGKENARLVIQSIMLRLLATLPPGKLRFTCLDPVGLGATMAGLIKGLPDILTGGQAWFDTHEIEIRLADLEKHIANVKQKYLGYSFRNMEEYNAQAGEVAEPYRLLVISDFPARFSDSAAQRLISIATNGPGTGVYLLMMVDGEQKLPYNFNLEDIERTATIISCDAQQSVWHDPDFAACALTLDQLPDIDIFQHIVGTVGETAVSASEVKVPFSRTVLPPEKWWQADTRANIQVPIGRRGAQEIQLFELDEKLLSSGLVIGRTGAGKSSLLHDLIINLALYYSPDELELYLLDFKKVEFKDYAIYALPHARVIAIQSEREFGMSVLTGLDQELQRRSDLFRDLGFQSLSEYRQKTGKRMPRLLLIADEFQELFNVDDVLASQASLILDRLVRMGRAFGINVLLASQTLAGNYSLSRSTKDQIPIRIALQCADADSRLILSDENDRARLLERPGEAIYNAANGRIEGNNLFQAFWLPDEERETYLHKLQQHSDRVGWQPVAPQIVFDGNAPANIVSNRDLLNLLNTPNWPVPQRAYSAWLGEPIEIKTHTAAILRRQTGSNLLIIGQNEHEPKAVGMLVSAVLGLAAQHSPADASFVLINLCDVDSAWHDLPAVLAEALPHTVKTVGRRGTVATITELTHELEKRVAEEEENRPPSLYMVIFGLQRHRDLRLPDNYYPVSGELKPPAAQLAEICQEGPDLGIHTLLWCDTYAYLERVFGHNPEKAFDLRAVLQMNSEDSRRLLDTDAASKLGPHRAIYFDEDRAGRAEKFRPYGLPEIEWLVAQGKNLQARVER